MVSAVQASSVWDECAIIIGYDENGGRWDHVAPPRVDVWGPGSRVPMIIISPYSKKGFVDHTPYDTTSILKFIETRWNLRAADIAGCKRLRSVECLRLQRSYGRSCPDGDTDGYSGGIACGRSGDTFGNTSELANNNAAVKDGRPSLRHCPGKR